MTNFASHYINFPAALQAVEPGGAGGREADARPAPEGFESPALHQIAVGNPQYGQLHRYIETTTVAGRQIYCSGQWWEVGTSPCEDAERRALPDPEDLPPCEASDEDLAAARELLGTSDRVWICKQKGRASWQDVVISPDAVQTQAALQASIYQIANRALLEEIRNPLPHLRPGLIGDGA